MRSRGYVLRALLSALFIESSALADEKASINGLMASAVCVIGDLPSGSFEASGFVVPPGDLVMTTAHSIGAVANLRIKLRDGRLLRAKLERLGNENADIALLEIPGARLTPVRFGGITSLRTGDPVRTIGCPLGFEFSVSSGVVSSLRESDLGYPLIQSDIPVNPGSSGGPLFDANGRVVGIIKSSAKARERISFALPADLGSALLDRIDRERRAYALFNDAVLEPKGERKAALYRQSIELEPGRFEAHFNLALTLERLTDSGGAEAEYRKTLELLPTFEPAYVNLGALLYGANRYPDAIEVYQQALARNPISIPARNNLAEAYRAAGNRAKARGEFERVLKQNPSYAPAHYGLALLDDVDGGNRRQAVEHYRRYLELAPDASDADRVRKWLREAQSVESKR